MKPKVVIVMPAYNAARTIEKTYINLPKVYEKIILCDDASNDNTIQASKQIREIEIITHPKNKGYGGNQKTLYTSALQYDPDIIIMVHPDNQYNTSCLPEMIAQISNGQASFVMGSRIKSARKYGMPMWKYVSNRILTFFQNIVLRTKLSEFHSGLRAYDARILRTIPYNSFSDDFVFDAEMITCWRAYNHNIGEVDTECYYTDEVSSINFRRSVTYGLQTLQTLLKYTLKKYRSD